MSASEFDGKDSARFSSQSFDSTPPSYAAAENEPTKKESPDNPDGADEASHGGGDAVAPESDPAPILRIPEEDGEALREWRRQNAVRLEEKEAKEKALLREVIDQADKYKEDFYKKWKNSCENSRAANREKEKLSVESREKFHGEADKNYWEAIAELIPREIAAIEPKGKKGKEAKPSIVVIQGPKPGKPTELSRMRQILVKLKHKTPDLMMLSTLGPAKTESKSQ